MILGPQNTSKFGRKSEEKHARTHVGARASILTLFDRFFAVFNDFATPPKRKPLLPPGSPSPGTPKTDPVKSTAKGK